MAAVWRTARPVASTSSASAAAHGRRAPQGVKGKGAAGAQGHPGVAVAGKQHAGTGVAGVRDAHHWSPLALTAPPRTPPAAGSRASAVTVSSRRRAPGGGCATWACGSGQQLGCNVHLQRQSPTAVTPGMVSPAAVAPAIHGMCRPCSRATHLQAPASRGEQVAQLVPAYLQHAAAHLQGRGAGRRRAKDAGSHPEV